MKFYAAYFLLVSLLQLATTDQREPTISYISSEQVKDIGDTVDLQCTVQGAPQFPVYWAKKGDIMVISMGNFLLAQDTRYSVRFDITSSTFTLQIRDIQKRDAAKYMCQVVDSENKKITAEVDLLIRSEPAISNSTSSVVAAEGESVQLFCDASGYPYPTISWRRENNVILPTGGLIYEGNVLEISSIRKEDRGAYFCVAENGVGKRANRKISVAVEFAPVVSAPRPRLAQALQYDMDLECQVEAYPPPAIIWMKDDVQLSNNQHYSISHFDTADGFTDTTIRVIAIEKIHYGQYVCKATNRLGLSEGTSEAMVELIETTTPVCPPACGVSGNATETPDSATESNYSTTETPDSATESNYSTEAYGNSTETPVSSD